MSPIQIDMDEVQRLSTKLRQLEQRLFETIDNVSSMAQRVEGSIQARRNMGDRLHGASQRLDELGDQVRALRSWIQRSCDAYAEAENQLSHQAAQIGEAGKRANTMGGQAGEYDTVTVVPLSEQTEENLTVMAHTTYSALQWVQEKHQSGYWSSMKKSLLSDAYMLKGIGEEAWDTVKSAGELAMDVNPVVQIYRWLSDPEGQKAEYKAREQLVLHPVQTWNVIKDGIVDDFRRQVVEGDDRSRSEYEGRRIFDFASLFMGVGEAKIAATAFKEFRAASKAIETAEEAAARAERAAESVTRAGGSGKIDETLADSLTKQDGLKETTGREANRAEGAGEVTFTNIYDAVKTVGSQFNGQVTQVKNGWKVEVPHGNKPIVVRVMNEGSGGRTQPYFRVSVDGKGSLTLDGKLSSNRGLTHIDMSDDYLNQITNMINKYQGK